MQANAVAGKYAMAAEISANEGGFAQVRKCKEKVTGRVRAIKKIDKKKAKNWEIYKKMVETLDFLDHPGITTVFD